MNLIRSQRLLRTIKKIGLKIEKKKKKKEKKKKKKEKKKKKKRKIDTKNWNKN